MAGVSTRLATLVVAVLGGVVVAGAMEMERRMEVPVHHGGAPVVEHRQGPPPVRHVRPRDGHGYPPAQYGGGGYQEDTSVLPYVLPVLAVTGLSLLFPNIVTVNTTNKRRRRGAESSLTEELTEHMVAVYTAALESDECLQRVVCELGATAKGLQPSNKDLIVSVLGNVAPKKYSSLFNKFKSGLAAERCDKIGCPLMDP